jgi:hypothetical protein
MTLLMAIDGKIKIPKISSPWDLKQVLTTLGGISADRLVAFELLWTPQVIVRHPPRNEMGHIPVILLGPWRQSLLTLTALGA